MPFPSQQVETLVRALAASLTPLTIAAVIVDLRANDQTTDADQDLADYAERGLYAITGTKTRERSRWCGGVRKYGCDKDAKPRLERDRYHALNLANLATGSKKTVEFRVFSGSLSPVKILGWIQVCLGLVERAVTTKRMPKWNPAPVSGGWKKAGDGQSETERLIGFLAWGNGYRRTHNGRQYGWISDAISQNEVKAEFRRLAAKYDAQA